MKLIIAGGRDITDYSTLISAIMASGFWRFKNELEIVSGMARGADTLGLQLAERNNLIIHKFPANWIKYHTRAGPLRNIEMGDFADALLALWDGKSRGTKHMIDYATKKGLVVYVHRVDLNG